MTSIRLAFAAMLAAGITFVGAGTASAEYAPAPAAEIETSAEVVAPGAPFTVTFDVTPINCSWALQPFQGQTAPGGSGSTYTVTLTAPTEPGTYTVTALCTWDPAGPAPATAPAEAGVAQVSPVALVAAPQTDAYSAQIVVGTPGGGSTTTTGSQDSGLLPDTGGVSTELLLVGGALVIAGAGVTVAARRRRNA